MRKRGRADERHPLPGNHPMRGRDRVPPSQPGQESILIAPNQNLINILSNLVSLADYADTPAPAIPTIGKPTLPAKEGWVPAICYVRITADRKLNTSNAVQVWARDPYAKEEREDGTPRILTP